MKKTLFIFVLGLAIVSSLAVVETAFAQNSAIAPSASSEESKSTKPVKVFPLQNPLKFDNVGDLLNNFADIVAFVLVIVAVILIIFTGFQFVAAQGKPEELKRLGAKLGYILLGVAIVIGARLIVSIVINTLESTGAVSPSTINNAREAANPIRN